MKRKEHLIWSNIDLDLEDWKEMLSEIEQESFDEPLTEDGKWELVHQTNNDYLQDERMNLDIELDGSILIIASLGLWNGRKPGYKIMESRNIKDILTSDCDYVKWYSDGYDIRAEMVHHDGTNFLLYREIRNLDNIGTLTDKIYNDTFTRADVLRYTRSILGPVKRVYGW